MTHRRTGAIVLAVALGVAALAAVLAISGGRADRGPAAVRDRQASSAPLTASPRAADGSKRDAGSDGRPTSLAIAGRLEAAFDLTISSGYRDAAHNAAVGGAEGSFHTRGTPRNPGAVDLVGRPEDMRRALSWARRRVRGLAEGIIHAVCVIDYARPWRVRDGGLHLHLAFASPRQDVNAPTILVATRSGCRSAADQFKAALAAIRRKRAADEYSSAQALRATVRTTSMALDGSYGRLGHRGRTMVAAARRRARTVLDRAIAARREAARVRAYERYSDAIETIDLRERSGELSAGDARSKRLATIKRALADRYGKLTPAQRSVVIADRAAILSATEQVAPVQTTTQDAAPLDTTPAPPAAPAPAPPAPAPAPPAPTVPPSTGGAPTSPPTTAVAP